ncbi:MAG: ABC transporter ATP-binding protein/permease, partial [Ruminococcus sp.]|nr:ABC transporter ATP-binding protein/permease [Ruminococcus sp.]
TYQEKKFDKVNDDITKNHLFTSRIMGLMMPVMMMAMNGLTLAIYWIGAYLINNAEITGRAEVIGNMTAFTQYALQIMGAFMMLVMIFIIMPRTMVSAKRINEVLDTQPTIDYKTQEVKTTGHGKIEFKNVSFSYSDSGKPCLKNLNFEINEGETFAIIGATGTGKSTLVNLIPRYYDTTAGEVLIDGVNIKEYPEEQLEKMVSVAPQKATLFSGDIKSNITYGCKENISDSDERIKKALEVSKSDFVGNLAEGIHSKVAQGGTNYSGGQKQRLSIARAVFKNSEIMIFDDTFSALDYKTDMLVRKSIREELTGTTVIIVAQRIGTIRNADNILVLHDGEIAGIGKHEELMENCPIYKEIALSQLSEEELSGKECL